MMDDQYDYVVFYMGEVQDICASLEEAKAMRTELVQRIKANLIPDFLTSDDISGVNDFPIRRVPIGVYH